MAQIGVDIGDYTFDASAQTITFIDVTVTRIEQIKPIVNGERGEVIFNPAVDGRFGTLVGNVLNLEYDTTLQDDADELYICINLPNSELPPTGTGTFVDAGNVFSWAGEVEASSSSVDNPLFLLKNPSGNTKKIFLAYTYGGLVTPSNYVLIKMFANPTITSNGTIRTPVNNSIGSINTSTMQVYTSSTVSDLGQELRNLIQGGSQNSIKFVEENTIQVLPNQSVIITGRPQNNNKFVSLTVIWIEIDV